MAPEDRGFQMVRALAVVAFVMVVLACLSPPGAQPAGAQADETHCPTDPNADHYVDISDIATIGAHFGQAQPQGSP